ncbi:MAG: TraR/DksA C4-type zinc finger protein [Candidatus Paceibacterota bacterium]
MEETIQSSAAYSPEELSEFHSIIKRKLEKVKINLDYFSSLTNSEESGTHDTSRSFKGITEEARELSTKDSNLDRLIETRKMIVLLENSLIRVKQKTYGICFVTGKKIPKQRLIAVPEATTSIEGQRILEQREGK